MTSNRLVPWDFNFARNLYHEKKIEKTERPDRLDHWKFGFIRLHFARRHIPKIIVKNEDLKLPMQKQRGRIPNGTQGFWLTSSSCRQTARRSLKDHLSQIESLTVPRKCSKSMRLTIRLTGAAEYKEYVKEKFAKRTGVIDWKDWKKWNSSNDSTLRHCWGKSNKCRSECHWWSCTALAADTGDTGDTTLPGRVLISSISRRSDSECLAISQYRCYWLI